jgi:hypothetical protein
MNNKKTKSYILLAVLALSHTTTHAADFNASLLDPIYYSDGAGGAGARVEEGVVSFGYFNNLSVSAVTTGIAGASSDLMGYYTSNFSELYRANIVAGSLNYSVSSGSAPLLLEQAAGQAMWARVSAQSGANWLNGLFVLTDTLANPDVAYNWMYSDFADSINNTFVFATKYTGETTPDDYSIVSRAVLGGSGVGGSTDKLTLSSVATSVAVPEPSSMSLMIFGATALVALRRMRKKV